MTELDGLVAVCRAFEARMPSPAGVSAAAATAAIAASVVVMAGDGSPAWEGGPETARRARDVCDRLLVLAQEDVEAFGAVLRAARGTGDLAESLTWAVRVPFEVAELSVETAMLAQRAVECAKRPMRPDVSAAAALATTAAEVALSIVHVNLGHPAFPPEVAAAVRAETETLSRALG